MTITAKNTKVVLLHALSPLHAGTGQGVGLIDLPVARETATGMPYLAGSSLKGALRSQSQYTENEKNQLFGKLETTNTDDNTTVVILPAHAGAVSFGDAKLLLLPVRSLAGTFAWVTSPYLLTRAQRDLDTVDIQINIPSFTEKHTVYVATDSTIKYGDDNNVKKVYLEDLDLAPQTYTDITTLANVLKPLLGAEFDDMTKRLCIVSDDVMNFLLNTALEIRARIAITQDTKIVNNLWYEEMLPTESVLISLLHMGSKGGLSAEDAAKSVDSWNQQVFQFGGKATTGHGICKMAFVEKQQ